MKFNRISECSTLTDEQMTEVVQEKKPLHLDQRKRELGELLLSLNYKLDELSRFNHPLSQMTNPFEKKELDGDRPSSGKFLQKIPSQDALTDPVLTYRVSWLLDFLRGLYGFEDCGIFLLDHGKGGLERLVLSSGFTEQFEDEMEALCRRGDIDCAVSQKRRIVLPAKKEGNFLIIPFKILDKKDGIWVVHFAQSILPDKKSSAELLFWGELFASCIESSHLIESSFSPHKEKSYHIETEKLFTTGELSKAVVHEINNSLQIIFGKTQVLKMNEKRSKKMPSGINNLETIQGNTNRIYSILKDFSDHLHRQFDETTETGEVNIQHILKSNLVLLKYILKSNRISWEADLDDDLPLVYGNPGELELAFLSLIWEIQDRLSSGGSIRLQASSEEDSLCLEVFCKAKEGQTDEHSDFGDLKTNGRFNMVSQILERYHGNFKFEKLADEEMKFSLGFILASEGKKTNQETPQELKL
ncbi:MAG: hypothetical protein KAW02_02530 [candidate division Zixibacteria bacterium]|nr:hypothetical protein [candidate division Zixibacteria bacterium]